MVFGPWTMDHKNRGLWIVDCGLNKKKMISEVFIRRPVTAIVISLVIVLVGIIAIINLPVSQYPNITPPVVSVAGNYTGADAQTVEQTVTTPIETQING